jgi:hypothetical protein
LTHEELCSIVENYAGPRTPWSGTEEEIEVAFERALQLASIEDFRRLVHILCLPPPCSMHPSHAVDWRYALGVALARVGARDSVSAANALQTALRVEHARETAIVVLGELGAVEPLGDLLGQEGLTESELLALADALGEVGAVAMLAAMRERYAHEPSVCREIDILLT